MNRYWIKMNLKMFRNAFAVDGFLLPENTWTNLSKDGQNIAGECSELLFAMELLLFSSRWKL
jgi:hypothetical protein